MRRRGRLKRFLLRILGVVVLLAVVLPVAVKFWIAPVVIRWQINLNLSEYWNGKSEIEDIEFNYFSPIRLRGIRILDRDGREWIGTDSLELTLRDWPGDHPVLTAVRIDNLRICAHFRDGRCAPPLRPEPPKSEKANEYVDLQSLTVRNGTFTMADANGNKITWSKIELSAQLKKGSYDVSLTEQSADGFDSLTLTGTIDQADWQAKLELDATHKLKPTDGAVLASCLDWPLIRTADGTIKTDNLTLTGRLDEPKKLWPDGTVELKRWNVTTAHGRLVSNANVTVDFDAERSRVETKDSSAEIAGGTVKKVYGLIHRDGDGAFHYRAQATGDNMRLGELVRSLTGDEKVRKGILKARFAVKGQIGSIESMKANCRAFVDDADVISVPIFSTLFAAMELGRSDPLKVSDIETTFSMSGLLITIEKARMANALAALAVEEGGTINLDTEHLDFYVVGVPLKALRSILDIIPGVRLLARIKDSLMRVRVYGPWTDPPGNLIALRPLENIESIGNVTQQFFLNVSRSGGSLSGNVLKGIADLLNGLGRKKEEPEKK